MARMAAAFMAARPPRAENLPGMWVEVGNEHSFDSTGIRLADIPGRPLAWMLSFRRDSPGRLVVRQVMSDAMPDLSVTQTTGDHDVRATLSYSDSAISGEIEDYTIARVWLNTAWITGARSSDPPMAPAPPPSSA